MHEEIKIDSTDEDGRQWLSKTIFNDDGSQEHWHCYTLPTSFDNSLYTSLQDYINWLKDHGSTDKWELVLKQTKREVEIQLLCRCHLSRILHNGWYEKAYGVQPSWEQIIAEMKKFRHFATHEIT